MDALREGTDWRKLPEQELLSLMPEGLREIASVVSLEAAIKLVDAFGGTTLQPPTTEKFRRELYRAIGRENADKLCERYGGGQLYVAGAGAMERSLRNRNIVALYGQGTSRKELARGYGLTERAITKILNRCD